LIGAIEQDRLRPTAIDLRPGSGRREVEMNTLLPNNSAAIIIACLLAPASAYAQEQVATNAIQDATEAVHIGRGEMHVTEGIGTYYHFDTTFHTLAVGDPSIVDVAALTDHSVLIEAHKSGTTNLVLFDANKVPLKDLTVIVGKQGVVRIHNKAMINSYTEFTCWKSGCQFVGENTVAEPAPLPHGWSHNLGESNSNSNSNSNINSNSTETIYHGQAAPQPARR
jgi:hypothetical protein